MRRHSSIFSLVVLVALTLGAGCENAGYTANYRAATARTAADLATTAAAEEVPLDAETVAVVGAIARELDAFLATGDAAGAGWLATEATGWLDIDMGEPRDIVAFSLGASHDGTAYTYPTKWKLTLHNGNAAAGRVVYDNTSGAVAWTNTRQSRATILSEAAAGRFGCWTTIQAQQYISATHRRLPRNGFIRIDFGAPQSGAALDISRLRVYDGSNWIAGAMTQIHTPLGYQAVGTLEAQYAYTALQAGLTTGWYIADVGGASQSIVFTLPTDPADIRGLEISGPIAGAYTRGPGDFTMYTWGEAGWTQRGNASGIVWTALSQSKQYTWWAGRRDS